MTQPTTIGIARSSAGAPTPLPTENPPAGAIYEFTPDRNPVNRELLALAARLRAY